MLQIIRSIYNRRSFGFTALVVFVVLLVSLLFSAISGPPIGSPDITDVRGWVGPTVFSLYLLSAAGIIMRMFDGKTPILWWNLANLFFVAAGIFLANQLPASPAVDRGWLHELSSNVATWCVVFLIFQVTGDLFYGLWQKIRRPGVPA